jgi:amino acid permease
MISEWGFYVIIFIVFVVGCILMRFGESEDEHAFSLLGVGMIFISVIAIVSHCLLSVGI